MWSQSITETQVLSAELEIGADIDGDPCRKLVLLAESRLLTVAEGTDVESLDSALVRVHNWIATGQTS